MKKIIYLFLLFCIKATTSFGGDYQAVSDRSRFTGMGLIGTSLNFDAGSIFYNPGGMSFLNDKWSFSGGMDFVIERATFQGKDENYQAHLEHELSTPFYLYAAYKATDKLSIGFAVNTPYGKTVSWGDTWQGRFLIQNMSYQAITVQPTLSYKFNKIISLGFGFFWSYGNITVNKAMQIDYSGGEGQLNIRGSNLGFGLNAGVIVHPIQNLSIGIDFRSRISMNVDGANATFVVPIALRSQFPDSKVEVSMPTPSNLDFGASYVFDKKFMIGINLNFEFWKKDDSLVFNFNTKTSSLGRTATPAPHRNTLIPKIGFQYIVNSVLTVRAGGYYDPSPVPSDYMNPQSPSTDKIGLTAGLAVFPLKGFSIDAAFLYLMGMKRDGTYSPENFAGTYNTASYIPQIGLTYSF